MAAAFLLLAPSAYQLNPAIPTRSCVRLSASDDEASGAAALDPRVAELAPPEAHERMQAGGARLLDVREPAAFALAHVPGALSVPAGEASPGGTFFRFHADFADHVAQLPATPDSALILACDAGAVSRVACGRLIDAGYGDVAVVRGGLDAWRAHEAGLPINLGAPPAAADDDVESEFGGEAEFIADDAWYAEGLRPAISAVAPADDDDADADLDELDDLDGLDLDDDEVRPARTARRDTHPPTLFSLGLSSPQMTALAAEVGVEVPTDPPHTPQVAETTAAAASALADTGGGGAAERAAEGEVADTADARRAAARVACRRVAARLPRDGRPRRADEAEREGAQVVPLLPRRIALRLEAAPRRARRAGNPRRAGGGLRPARRAGDWRARQRRRRHHARLRLSTWRAE